MMMRLLVIALGALLVFFNYLLWFNDETGFEQVRILQRDIREQQEENARLQERNRALEAEVKSLKNDLNAIEERARSEMGMVRRDETFFHILDKPLSQLPELPPSMADSLDALPPAQDAPPAAEDEPYPDQPPPQGATQ